jgi:NAD(P)-dependent dehydrogenase (short-subunit alcohol dehydrogenase family)
VTGPAVLITGGLTGIGRATALAFAREGARIVVSGRHDDKGNALVSELQEIGVGFFLLTSPRFERNSLWSYRSNNRPSTKSTFYDET